MFIWVTELYWSIGFLKLKLFIEVWVSFKTTQIYYLTVLEVKSKISVVGLKIKALAGLWSFWRLMGESVSWSFPASRGSWHSLACGFCFHLPSTGFQPLLLLSLLFLPPSSSRCFLWLWPSCLPLPRTLWSHWAHLDNRGNPSPPGS